MALPSDSNKLEYDYNSSQMKLTIEELTIKLEEKSMLLTKAKHAIETLTYDNNKMKLEKDHSNELEERLQKLKKSNDDMNNQYHSQFVQLEADLISARHLYTSKSNDYIEITEKYAKSEVTSKLLLIQLNDSNNDKEKLKEQIVLLTQRYNDIEDEITQCKAHVDLYKLQYDEIETTLTTTTTNHHNEVSRLNTDIDNIKNNYLLELEQMNEYMKQQIKKIKDDDNKEDNTIIEKLKNDNSNLTSVIDKSKLHSDALIRELDAVRIELRIKTDILDDYRKEIGGKAEEVNTLRKANEQNAKLKETISHLNMEKGVLITKFEHIKRDHEIASDNLSRLQSTHATLEVEHASVKKEITNLRIRCELVEEISRENERLRMNNVTLKGDIQDLVKFKDECNKWYNATIKARDDLGFYESQFSSMTLLKEELEVQLNQRNEKINTLESLYTEAKNNVVELTHSLLDSNNALSSIKSTHKELLGVCNAIGEMIPTWDEMLTMCLDGNVSINNLIDSKSKSGRTLQYLSPKLDRHHHDENDDNNNNNTDKLEPATFKRDIILGMERIRMKMERAQRIRANFDNQSKRLIDVLIASSNTAEMQLGLANHRINDAANKINILQRAIDRDHKLREEFQEFKEKVMREQEDKYHDVCIQLETKRKDEEKYLHLIDTLSSTVDTQKLKLNDYDDVKLELQNSKIRIIDISKDLEMKNVMVSELRDTSNTLKVENVTLIEKNSKLEEKLQQLVDQQSENVKEIEQLKKGQIDPELAMQIRQTQTMIQESVLYDRSPTHGRQQQSMTLSSKDEMIGSSKQTHDMSELLDNADSLINRIADLISRFENFQRHGMYEISSNIISQFEQDLYTVLEATSRMSFQLQMLTAEIRKSNRNSNETMNFNNEGRSKMFSSTPIRRIINENKGSSQWGDTFASSVGMATTTGLSPDEMEFQPKNTVFNDIVYPSSSTTKITPILTDNVSNLSQTYPYASPNYNTMQPRQSRESRESPFNSQSYYDKNSKVTMNTNTSVSRRVQNNKLEIDLKNLSKKLDNIKNNFM